MGAGSSRQAEFNAVSSWLEVEEKEALLKAYDSLASRREQDGIDIETFKDFTTPLSADATLQLHKYFRQGNVSGKQVVLLDRDDFAIGMAYALKGSPMQRRKTFLSLLCDVSSLPIDAPSGVSSTSSVKVERAALETALQNIVHAVIHLARSEKHFDLLHSGHRHHHHHHHQQQQEQQQQGQGEASSSHDHQASLAAKRFVEFLLAQTVPPILPIHVLTAYQEEEEKAADDPAYVKKPVLLENPVPSTFDLNLPFMAQWTQRFPLLDTLFECLFRLLLNRELEARFPASLRCSPTFSPRLSVHHSHLLDQEALWVLNAHLPAGLRSEWRKLYNNVENGDSFNRFVVSIENKGPFLIVIRDKGGNVFGGFSAMNCLMNANFYGTTENFIFSLAPKLRVYLPSGINQNYLYYNHGMQTLPNGLGMGGQFDYFGFFVDSNLKKGHSKGRPLSSTFSNPSLSSTPEFDIDIVEAWGIGPVPDADTLERRDKEKSILDNLEERAIMEIAGKPHYSAGIRETNLLDSDSDSEN